MKKAILATIVGLSVIACPILYFLVGPALDPAQLQVLRTLVIIAGCSALFCFTVGEITGNNSQMDKLWSLLLEIYIWIIAIEGGMKPRLVVMAVLATLWGIRLTYNFARKGAYHLKFWEGNEDYRWPILGALLLVVLFQGSSSLGEEISGEKYPEYRNYCSKVLKFLPFKKYR